MNRGDSTSVIKRVKLEASDGRPPLQYRIQFIDESSLDEAIMFMNEYFWHNNLTKSIGPIEEDKGSDDVKAFSFREIFLSKGDLSVAAFLEDELGNRGRIICCNVLAIEKMGQKIEPAKAPKNLPKRIIYERKTMDDVVAKANVFTLYNCDAYLRGFGLATNPEFQGRGIGGEILRARAEVCRLANTPVCATVFTGLAVQRLAQKCGYETVAELDLATYRIDGKLVYPNPEWPIIKWMAKRYF